MKTDLKDFPKRDKSGVADICAWALEVIKWREDFEKALRQELKDVARDEQLPQDIERDLTLMLKEILGDMDSQIIPARSVKSE